MNETYSTGLIEIRDFLREHRCVPAPWSAPRDVVDGLYVSLAEKRGDESFWRELKRLVSRLDDRRVNTAALRNLEVLSDGALDKIVDDLRVSLNGGNGRSLSGVRQWVSRPVSIAALLGFLVLGTAVGCDEGDDNEPCQEAQDQDLSGHEAGVYCELVHLIRSADIDSWVKEELLDCLPELDADFREAMLEAFQNLTDDELAEQLEYMAISPPCDEGSSH